MAFYTSEQYFSSSEVLLSTPSSTCTPLWAAPAGGFLLQAMHADAVNVATHIAHAVCLTCISYVTKASLPQMSGNSHQGLNHFTGTTVPGKLHQPA